MASDPLYRSLLVPLYVASTNQVQNYPRWKQDHSAAFFGETKALLQFIAGVLVCTEAYLTHTTQGSWSANLELLLSSHCFTWTHDSMYYLCQISAATGPCIPAVMTCLGCPSPSSPQFTPLLTATNSGHHPAPSQTLCNTRATLMLPPYHPWCLCSFQSQLSPSHSICVTFVSPHDHGCKPVGRNPVGWGAWMLFSTFFMWGWTMGRPIYRKWLAKCPLHCICSGDWTANP